MSRPPENEFVGGLPSVMADFNPEVGIVLGSGLGSFVDRAEIKDTISYEDLDGLPRSTVPGHAGQFVLATLGKTRLIIAQGRVHLYEGHAAPAVTAGIRCLAATGISRLVLTNAAGTANKAFSPGTWMMLSDHLNLTGTTPLLGGPNFFDMSEVYSQSWRQDFRAIAETQGMGLHEGVYAGLLGPQYETPAEVRMVQALGGDAVGMSTVLEAIQAKALGIEVAGFSCLTNWGAGLGQKSLDHSEVMEMGLEAAGRLVSLLEEALS